MSVVTVVVPLNVGRGLLALVVEVNVTPFVPVMATVPLIGLVVGMTMTPSAPPKLIVPGPAIPAAAPLERYRAAVPVPLPSVSVLPFRLMSWVVRRPNAWAFAARVAAVVWLT